MKLVDANVLLYAVNSPARQHAEASAWIDRALVGQEAVGFAWGVVLAFLRIATHPRIFQRPLTSDDALRRVRAWLTQPTAVIVMPMFRHLDVLAGLLGQVGVGGNLIHDAHLAALAVEHGASIVTYDVDFARFPGVAFGPPGS